MPKNTPINRKIRCQQDGAQLRLSQNPSIAQMERVMRSAGAEHHFVMPMLAEDPDFRHIVEQKLYQKAGVMIDWDEGIACGSFGCAFETNQPDVVVKITEDANEAPGALALKLTKKWWPGLIGVHDVYQYPEYPIWIITTERVGTLGDKINFLQDEGYMKEIGLADMNETFEPSFEDLLSASSSMISFMTKFQRLAVEVILHGREPKHGADVFWEEWINKFTDLAAGFTQLDAIRTTYEDLWYNHGIVYPDIHMGNLGFRVFDGPGVGPSCVPWDVEFSDKHGNNVKLMGPEILCLDLGLSTGTGIKAARKKRMAKLNPLFDKYIPLIPEL